MKRVIFLTIVAAILLVPWAVAYGYDKVNAADISASIEPADQSLVPTIHVFGNAVGSISNGDLFTIDTSGATTNTTFTLLIANVDELINYYRFLTMNIGLYVQTGTDSWEKMTTAAGGSSPEMHITMDSIELDFSLPGNAKYKVTVESGSYRSFSITKGKSVAIPEFSLTAG
jgi:hypothetical protein